jgi:hypothetical protein
LISVNLPLGADKTLFLLGEKRIPEDAYYGVEYRDGGRREWEGHLGPAIRA